MPHSIINGVRLYWERTGRGDPLVLVHGSWGDHLNWAPVVPGLSRLFSVVTYDRRGHSRSEAPPGQGSVRSDAADLAGVITELCDGRAHVVGSSFGASITLRLACERPELLRTLSVHEPPLFGLLEGEPGSEDALAALQERAGRVAALLQDEKWSEGAELFVDAIAFGPGGWAQLPEQARKTFTYNAPTWLDEWRDPESLLLDTRPLRKLVQPVMLTVGTRSPPIFGAVADVLARAMPWSRRHTYAEAGHVPHVSHPEEFVSQIHQFCAPRLGVISPEWD